jgi:hypothetical protein
MTKTVQIIGGEFKVKSPKLKVSRLARVGQKGGRLAFPPASFLDSGLSDSSYACIRVWRSGTRGRASRKSATFKSDRQIASARAGALA